MNDLWPEADAALEWLNRLRNEIAHAGKVVESEAASFAIFASIKIVAALDKAELIDASFPAAVMRSAAVNPGHAIEHPKWIPTTWQELKQDPIFGSFV